MTAEPWNVACPSCKATGVRCVIKEAREGSPCCDDCAAQTYQRPMHVWERKS